MIQHTVDGRNPKQPPGMCKTLVDNGIFIKSTDAGFLPSTMSPVSLRTVNIFWNKLSPVFLHKSQQFIKPNKTWRFHLQNHQFRVSGLKFSQPSAMSTNPQGSSKIIILHWKMFAYSHRIHVWYIYLHLPSNTTIHVGKYTSPMDPMGLF